MTKHRWSALLTSAAAALSLSGCSDNTFFKTTPEDSSESESSSDESADEYSSADFDGVIAHAEQLLADVEISDNYDTVVSDMEILLNDLDELYELFAYTTIAYYSDWYDEELEAEYDSCYEAYYVSDEILCYAFSNCYMVDEYSDIFEDYIYPDYLEYYTNRSMSLNRLIGYSKVDYEVMDENLDAYYDIVNDSTIKDSTKNLEAAEIYLDILSVYDVYIFYDIYNRDFTPEEIIFLTDTIIDEIVPVSEALGDAIASSSEYADIYYNPVTFDNPFEVIAEYAGRISPEIEEYAQLLLDDELYCLTDGSDCYNGSFAVDLPAENSALIYVYDSEDFYNLLTPIHEFGHFYASFYDDTTTYLMENNMDVAEIQSQGMEVLFMELYDDIFGDQAETMRALKLYDTIDSITSGFAIGEFEYTVLKNIDTMTPESVVELFDSIMEKYGYTDVEFYYITHIFEQPGYYISYGVSALAALDIWSTVVDSYDDAVEMYERISQVPINSGECRFSSALEGCGFDDVLTEDYIKRLSDYISEYISVYAESIA